MVELNLTTLNTVGLHHIQHIVKLQSKLSTVTIANKCSGVKTTVIIFKNRVKVFSDIKWKSYNNKVPKIALTNIT